MCYSAQVWSDYRKYIREFLANVGIPQFRNLVFRRNQRSKLLETGPGREAHADVPRLTALARG